MHQPFSRDVNHSDLVGILEFIYNGEVSIEQDCLPGFLAVAETLRIRGLTGEVCHLFYLSLYFNSLLFSSCRVSMIAEKARSQKQIQGWRYNRVSRWNINRRQLLLLENMRLLKLTLGEQLVRLSIAFCICTKFIQSPPSSMARE